MLFRSLQQARESGVQEILLARQTAVVQRRLGAALEAWRSLVRSDSRPPERGRNPIG